MNTDAPYIGIDFGTTFSSMAWYNPGNNPPHTGRTEIVLNSDGEPKTPSLVHYGKSETLVGKLVDEMLEDASDEHAERDEVFQRTVRNIKRDLIAPPRIALPSNRFVRPVEVAAEILGKLKRDAEDGIFHTEIPRAVITCPAAFNAVQRQVIERAGRLAGFEEVVLLEEPVAGALAYARSGLNVGQRVLVYDLGGGTFDLAVLDNEDGSFQVALPPRGIDKIGGEDFDQELYYYCDGLARERLGRPVSLTGNLDLKFLRRCRERKENLSVRKRVTVSSLLLSDHGTDTFQHELDRETFHELIKDYVETTVRLTEAIVEEAKGRGHGVDTVVLIGGSSKVLLVRQMLDRSLPVKPLDFHQRDVAVALGAAHYGHIIWGEWIPPKPTPLDQYRAEVNEVSGKRLGRADVDRLRAAAERAGLSREEAAEAEREAMGMTAQVVYDGQLEDYRKAVGDAWRGEKLDRARVDELRALAQELKVEEEASNIERDILSGVTKEEVLPLQYRRALREAWDRLNNLAGELGLSTEQAAGIEHGVLQEMGRSYLEEVARTREDGDDEAYRSYYAAVEEVWGRVQATGAFTRSDLEILSTEAETLGLPKSTVDGVEREVMGRVREDAFEAHKVNFVGGPRDLRRAGQAAPGAAEPDRPLDLPE